MYGDAKPEKRERLEIFKVYAGSPKRFLIRSDRPICFNAHFRERSLFCIGDGCVWCSHGLRRQWRGFVAAVKPPKQPGALELSAEAYDAWQALGEAGSLAGRIISVHRSSENSPAVPTAIHEAETVEWPLVNTVHLFDQICRLMGLPERSQYSGDDGWAYAVTCVYRQQLDAQPFFRLHTESPPLGQKKLA